MPSRGGNAQVQRQPAVVVVAVAEPARRRARRRRATMPVKSSASFRMTAVPMVVAAQLLAAAVLALALVWALHFRGGVSWERTSDPLLVYTVENPPAATLTKCYTMRSNMCTLQFSLSGTPSVHGDWLRHLHWRR